MILVLKQNKLVKEREWESTQKELGVSGKGRGKRPYRKISKSKVTPLITRVTSRRNQSLGSMSGIP